MQDGGTTRQTTTPLDLVLSFYGNGKLKWRRETVSGVKGAKEKQFGKEEKAEDGDVGQCDELRRKEMRWWWQEKTDRSNMAMSEEKVELCKTKEHINLEEGDGVDVMRGETKKNRGSGLNFPLGSERVNTRAGMFP